MIYIRNYFFFKFLFIVNSIPRTRKGAYSKSGLKTYDPFMKATRDILVDFSHISQTSTNQVYFNMVR